MLRVFALGANFVSSLVEDISRLSEREFGHCLSHITNNRCRYEYVGLQYIWLLSQFILRAYPVGESDRFNQGKKTEIDKVLVEVTIYRFLLFRLLIVKPSFLTKRYF